MLDMSKSHVILMCGFPKVLNVTLKTIKLDANLQFSLRQ